MFLRSFSAPLLLLLYAVTCTTQAAESIQLQTRDVKLHSALYRSSCGFIHANVLFIPGISSNSKWFDRHATALSQRCFNVLIVDRRGTGQSEGAKGDLLDKNDLVEDLKPAIHALNAISQKPLILMAISYGWKLPILFAKQNPEIPVDSIVLLAPTPSDDLKDEFKPSLMKKLSIKFSSADATFPGFIPTEALSDDPALRAWIDDTANSLTQKTYTQRFLLKSKELDDEAIATYPILKKDVLVVLPTQDKILDHAAIFKRFLLTPSDDTKRAIIKVDSGHVLDSPAALEQLSQALENWITKRSDY